MAEVMRPDTTRLLGSAVALLLILVLVLTPALGQESASRPYIAGSNVAAAGLAGPLLALCAAGCPEPVPPQACCIGATIVPVPQTLVVVSFQDAASGAQVGAAVCAVAGSQPDCSQGALEPGCGTFLLSASAAPTQAAIFVRTVQIEEEGRVCVASHGTVTVAPP